MLGQRNRYAGYRNVAQAGVEDEVTRFYANQRATPVLGDETFREWALAKGGESQETPRREQRRPVRSPDEVLAAVAAAWEVDGRALTARGWQLGPVERRARQVAMLLCRDETDLTLAAIGDRFGGIHYSAVAQNIRRVQAAMQKDGELGRFFRAVMSKFDL